MKRLLLLLLLLPLFSESQIITTIAGTGMAGYSGDGDSAIFAKFNEPTCIKINDSGDIFIADWHNSVIRKIRPSGIISTFAGNGTIGFSGDSALAITAQLNKPAGFAFDKYGNVYIADWGNNRIRKVDTLGIITTIAGTGITGYSGDSGLAINAQLNFPMGLTFDKSGNLYLVDHNNVVRKIDTNGIISTIAGTGAMGYSGNGGLADTAEFRVLSDVCFDTSGNLYVVDGENMVIRKIDTAKIVSTIAGIDGMSGYGGDSVLATTTPLFIPMAIAFDKGGNIFIADFDNSRIRKVNTLGIIYTIAGNGNSGYSGDGGLASMVGIASLCR